MDRKRNPFLPDEQPIPKADVLKKESEVNEAKSIKEVKKPKEEDTQVPKNIREDEADIADEPESLENSKEKAPGRYLHNYTKDDVLPVLDMLLNNGYAITESKIGKKTLILKTRFTWEEKAIYKYMESLNAKTTLRYEREFAFITIAASLVAYGNEVFTPTITGNPADLDKDLEKRLALVVSLNSVVTDIITKRLGDFDDKQRYIIDHIDELTRDF